MEIPDFSYSRFVYFDTCIISEIVKNRSLWGNLFEYLINNDLTLGLSTGQISELADAKNLHQELVSFLFGVPSALLKVPEDIVNEEVLAHPKFRNENLAMKLINSMLFEKDGIDNLLNFFASEKLSEARKQQKKMSLGCSQRIINLKTNFPPSKTGKYTKEQADLFVDLIVIQWLSTNHLDFLNRYKDRSEDLHLKCFSSIRMYAYVLFYKYYLGNRTPKKLSDFGDFGHLPFFPYCDLVVMERDLCNILNQIKRNSTILVKTTIKNIDFLDELSKMTND